MVELAVIFLTRTYFQWNQRELECDKINSCHRIVLEEKRNEGFRPEGSILSESVTVQNLWHIEIMNVSNRSHLFHPQPH
jgi:hypothetical protein